MRVCYAIKDKTLYIFDDAAFIPPSMIRVSSIEMRALIHQDHEVFNGFVISRRKNADEVNARLMKLATERYNQSDIAGLARPRGL